MKKRAIVLFLSIYMIVAMFTVIASVQMSGDSAEATPTAESTPTPTNRIDIIATNPFQSCAFDEYIYYGNPDTWIYPEAFIGSSAVFNLEPIEDWYSWTSFVIASKDEISAVNTVDSEGDVNPYANYVEIPDTELMVDNESIKVVVTDYVLNVYDEETMEGDLWFKVEAAEGYTLPVALQEKPYVLHLTSYNDPAPGLLFPATGMFTVDPVTFYKEPVVATKNQPFDLADLPLHVEIDSYYFVKSDIPSIPDCEYYGLSNISAWEIETKPDYQYVYTSSVELLPITVAHAYETLISSTTSDELYERLADIPDPVLASFSEAHKEKVVAHLEQLIASENVEYNTVVKINGKELDVAVKGKIPETGVTLSVNAVSSETILAEKGFGIKDATEIITALDIKMINDVDGTEWQPDEGECIEVSIDMASLGYEDGDLIRMHHKHGDKVDTYDVFVVMDGKATLITNGFSIYVVSNTTSQDTSGTRIDNNGTYTMTIGQTKVFYFSDNDLRNNSTGTWEVVDTDGAIYYTVHSNATPSNAGILVRWIKVTALKETSGITLRFVGSENNIRESYTIKVEPPKATEGDKDIYIKDDVNKTGRIVVTLVDRNGNEIENGLDGAAFSWTRDDGHFIVPVAYDDDYRGVNIARDHGGLVESRKDPVTGRYKPMKYTVEVILADGTELEASYTVYYQSEIINASFESPNATDSNYTFFPNGWDELYWKTTAPGATDDGDRKYSQDIEYGDVTNGTANVNNGTDFGVTHAADHATGGVQFAELNAEAFGSLYQDIISAPGDDIEWEFAHAPRRQQDWATDITNRMFIVIGATEDAQKLTTQDQLAELGAEAKKIASEAGKLDAFLNNEISVDIEYNGAKYKVWYHDAGEVGRNQGGGANGIYSESKNYGWTNLSGSYTVPNGQYRTRIFFVSDPPEGNNTPNAGNLIDKAKAGQYKDYLIEYYVETYNPDTHQTDISLKTTEEGSALIYSSVKLEEYIKLVKDEYYLYMILINDSKYPYDLSYYDSNPDDNQDEAWLYIEKYPGEAKDPLDNYSSAKYEGKDIVLQVYMRDTIVAISKEIELPAAMTEEQKLTLMENIKPYSAEFKLTDGNSYSQTDSADITKRDPSGKYKGFVALGTDLVITSTPIEYTVEETATTTLPGLELCKVFFKVQRYKQGDKINDELFEVSYEEKLIDDTNTVIKTDPFELGDNIKIADVTVVNTYREKQTTIIYHAIGNGKIKSNKEGSVFEDAPTETLEYYSGKSKGCSVHNGKGARFVGWYKDPSCSEESRVTAADGVWDSDGTFKPNANILNADVVHFYAKFETNSVTIQRTNGVPGQTYVYKVEATEGTATTVMYVTVTCGADGFGSTEIFEAVSSQYKVTEIGSWSWRSEDGQDTQSFTPGTSGSDAKLHITFSFNGKVKEQEWLNGYSQSQKNVYTESGGGS